LSCTKIHTIKQLDDSLKSNSQAYLKFFSKYLDDVVTTSSLADVIPYFFYLHYLSALKNDPKYILEYFDFGEIKIGSHGDGHLKILDTYKKISTLR
jgi:hypothetical protein